VSFRFILSKASNGQSVEVHKQIFYECSESRIFDLGSNISNWQPNNCQKELNVAAQGSGDASFLKGGTQSADSLDSWTMSSCSRQGCGELFCGMLEGRDGEGGKGTYRVPRRE
jgi:hypothetical protein